MHYVLMIFVLMHTAIVADTEIPSLPIDGSYPHHIKLDYDFSIERSEESNETVTVYQKGKRLYTINDYDIRMVYRGDLDGDGFEEAVLRTFSGGAHCCFRLVFLKLSPNMPKPKIYDWGNTEYITIKDLDGDKIPEIITWDDQYSYAFGLSFAESVGVKVIAHFQNDALHLDANLTKKYIAFKRKKLFPVKIGIDKNGFLSYSRSVRDIMEYVLHAFYVGEKDEAVKCMYRYLLFDHPAVKMLFLEELTNLLSKSPFWDDIRRLNHWEYDTGCIGDGCIPPEELWDKDNVLHWMFEES